MHQAVHSSADNGQIEPCWHWGETPSAADLGSGATQGTGAGRMVVGAGCLVVLLVLGLFPQEHIAHRGLSTSLAQLGGSAPFKPVLTLQFKVQLQCRTLPLPVTYL